MDNLGVTFEMDEKHSRPWKPVEFPRLSNELQEIEVDYDAIVVGSGYGASVAACRCARAGLSICVLERGKEWLPGDFPESFYDASNNVQITHDGRANKIGTPSDLYEFIVDKEMSVVQGCGLGGGSLINANVGLETDIKVLKNGSWPAEFVNDLDTFSSVDTNHAMDMLRPRVYPDSYPRLPKMDDMKKAAKTIPDIENLGEVFRKTPLYVNFESTKRNHVGVAQPACNNCGNCCSGCNTGAKNTLPTNYLADAKQHGAMIFVEVEVTAVVRDPHSTCWRVHYRSISKKSKFPKVEKFVRAEHVFIGAGAIGSSKVLLKSKARGLDVSDQVGKRFTGNGDFLGASFNGDSRNNPSGLSTGKSESFSMDAPGPTITTAIDLRGTEVASPYSGVVVQDGTCPGSLKMPFAATVAVMSSFSPKRQATKGIRMKKALRKLSPSAFHNSLAFLGMGLDNGRGHLTWDEKKDGVRIEWENVGQQDCFKIIESVMKLVTDSMGGSWVPNPMWSHMSDKSLVTAHPLGGCIMASSGRRGVVNHMGQVFMGNSDELHPGLYVIDGSIIPSAIGVNPSMTITSLAERCMRLLGEKNGWTMDYELNKDPVWTKKTLKPGIRFTERMVGEVEILRSSINSKCEFILTIESDDVEAMVAMDSRHSASVEGSVICNGLSRNPMVVSDGKFQLFRDSTEQIDGKTMLYDFDLTSEDGERFHFHGTKFIHRDSFGETGLKDTTLLFVEISKRIDENNEELYAKGELKMRLTDFMKQLSTIEVTNMKSTLKRMKYLSKFGGFFAKSLWDTYSGLAPSNLFDPDAPPRLKRALKLGDVTPQLYKVITSDKIELRLTRFQGGRKGPLLVTHGMGMSTNFFCIDTIETNLVEFFVENGYDIWLFDCRTSTNLPWSSHLQHNLDDIAEYDWEPAVDRVLRETGESDLQVLAHCVGSLSFFMALLRGKMAGKIRSILASQVALHPIAGLGNRIKAKMHAPGLLASMGVKEMNAYTDKKVSCLGSSLNCLTRVWTDALVETKEECRSSVCHRSTFMYNLLYNHGNLNTATHDCLHEIMGVATTSLFKHVAKMMRKGTLVDSRGKASYIINGKSKRKRTLQRLNIPITILVGEENEVFTQDGPKKSIDLLKTIHPEQSYEKIVIKGYGHLDNFIGKNASLDVYPSLLKHLDLYQKERPAETELQIFEIAMLKLRAKAWKDKVSRKPSKRLLSDSMDLRKQMTIDSEDGDFIDSRQFSTREDYDYDLTDADSCEVEEIRTHLENILPHESKRVWPPGNNRCYFQRDARYNLPAGSKSEPLFVERTTIHDNSQKREIFVLSDLHMGGAWSENIMPRLHEFVVTLAKIAEHCTHTIVLLGDIFEMWLTPMTMSPPTHREFLEKWKTDPAIQLFAKAIRKMADEDDVNIFYVRGNHDHEITAAMIKKMFGENVKFIPGRLIYIVTNGYQEYRIRFEHGHDYDLFNSYSILPSNSPLQLRPFGYFVTRAAATCTSKYMNDTEEVLESIIGAFLRLLPKSTLGAKAMEMLALTGFQKKLCRNLMERALRDQISDEECILLENDTWVKVEDILSMRFVQQATKMYGASRVFSMLRASLGVFDDFIREAEEDVVVFGHSHHWKNKKMTGRHGNVLYANAGTWIDLSEHFSYVRILPPKEDCEGFLEVNFKLTGSESKEK